MSLHFDERLADTVAITCMAKVGIDDISGMAEGPAIIRTILQSIDRLWRDIVAQQIAPVICDPDLFVPGIDSHADRVAQTSGVEPSIAPVVVVGPDSRALLILLNTVVAG